MSEYIAYQRQILSDNRTITTSEDDVIILASSDNIYGSLTDDSGKVMRSSANFITNEDIFNNFNFLCTYLHGVAVDVCDNTGCTNPKHEFVPEKIDGDLTVSCNCPSEPVTSMFPPGFAGIEFAAKLKKNSEA